VFVGAFFVGVVYAVFIRRTSHAFDVVSALKASNFGSMLYASGAFVIISYTDNYWLLIPATIGDWVGNSCGTIYDIWKKTRRIEWRKVMSIEEKK